MQKRFTANLVDFVDCIVGFLTAKGIAEVQVVYFVACADEVSKEVAVCELSDFIDQLAYDQEDMLSFSIVSKPYEFVFEGDETVSVSVPDGEDLSSFDGL